MANYETSPEQDPNAPQAAQPEGPIQYDKAGDPEAVKKLVEKHMTRFNRWADWRKPFETLWTEIYRLFMNRFSPSKLPTRATVSLPIVFQVLEAALPKIVTIIFGTPEWMSVAARSTVNPVDKDILDAKRDLLMYQFDLAEFYVKFIDFLKQMLLYGTSYFYVYQKVKREWVYERTPVRNNLTVSGIVIKENVLDWDKSLQYKVVERRPEVEVLDIADVYPDPDARNEECSQGYYVISTVTKEEFKELCNGKYPVYTGYDEVMAAAAKYEEGQMHRDRRAIRGTNEPDRGQGSDLIELLTFWGKEDLDGDGIREEVQIVFANRTVIAKATRNPFEHQKRPIIKGVLFPVPNEHYGIGLIEPVVPLVHELNTIRRQNIDMNNLIVNRMWKVNSMADVDLDTLVSAPNNIILTGDMDGVTPVAQDPIPVSPNEMSLLIQTDIENTTAPKSIQGAPSSGALGRTARGAQLIISQALEKFGMGAKLIEESAVRKVLVMFDQLNNQFLDSDEVMNEFYGDVIQGRMTPEQNRLEVTYKLQGVSETVTREATINQIMGFVNTFKGLPGIDLLEVARLMWNLMQIGHTDKVIQNPVGPAPFPQEYNVNMAAPAQGGDTVANQIAQNGASGLQIPKQ